MEKMLVIRESVILLVVIWYCGYAEECSYYEMHTKLL